MLSAVIGWLYVDAFVLKGVNSLVTRAELLPTRGFSRPYVVLRLYGLTLAAPYWIDTFLLLGVAGASASTRGASGARRHGSRCYTSATLGTRERILCGKCFASKCLKSPCRRTERFRYSLTYMNPFDSLRRGGRNEEERNYRRLGWAIGTTHGISKSAFLHVFVILFLSALLLNILYPTVLLKSSDVRYQRDLSFIADTALDIVYAVVPFVFLALGVRSQPMIIPHDPLEYTSNLVPMIHAHFVISTLEAAADESRALRKVAPCEPEADVD